MMNGVKMIEKIEKNANLTMNLYDFCNNKSDYKKLYNFVKDQAKELKELSKEDVRVYQIKNIDINERTMVTSIIKNYVPESLNDIYNPKPIEIFIDISGKGEDMGKGFHTNGSGFFGGCNESEINELVQIIKEGMSDFTKEII